MSKTRVWAASVLGVVVGLSLLAWFCPRGSGVQSQGHQESDPQFIGPPGIPAVPQKLWGVPNRDLYSSLNSPRYVGTAEAEQFLKDDDLVYLVKDGEKDLAFPEVLMTSYHVVNDVVADEPIAVTSCLLAGSTALFSRKVEDRVLTFGLTGQLYCGNSVLYDKETETDWLQLNGEPLRGAYLGKERLRAKPLEPIRWGRLKQRPNLRVLAPLQRMEDYRNFQREIQASKLGQKVVESQATLDQRLLPYTKGIGIQVQGEARFYPDRPADEVSLRPDKVGGWSVLLLRGGLDEPIRVFRRRCDDRVLDFDFRQGGMIDRETTSKWNEEGVCTEGPLRGTRLDTPYYSHVYWFVWSALYPGTNLGS